MNSGSVASSTGGAPKPYPAAWGWNSAGRAGNVTTIDIKTPSQLQKTRYDRYVECAAGKHHSLLINEEGKVFTFGDNKKGQLGYGSRFSSTPIGKGGVVQSFPRQITPSGVFKYKADLRIAQVAGGGTFSIGREACRDEGVALVTDFARIETALRALIKIYPDSNSIKDAWKYVRHERYHINRKSEGRVLVWGTGDHGELGLEKHTLVSPYPQPILKLRDVCITQVAAGERHVLAVDMHGHLYTWGCGSNGRLGHGDFENRFSPELVSFFKSLFVEYISAGDAHSAVLTTTKNGPPRETQIRRLSCFGRGAHGRLGHGTNRNTASPVLVSKWPPSVAGAQLHEVKCGGAHTVVRASIAAPKGIANPHGRITFVLTFGYGANGQLGTGYREDSFIPVRARLPKCELIAEVSAGRSWTIARSISGALFTWGKGLRGQLGQGEVHQFSLAPRKLDCAGSYLRVESKYAHNLALAVHQRHLNDTIVEAVAKREGDNYDCFAPRIDISLAKSDSVSKYQFNCCRRVSAPSLDTSSSRRFMRFSCEDCGVSSMCYSCARLCHHGHRLREVTVATAATAATTAAAAAAAGTPGSAINSSIARSVSVDAVDSAGNGKNNNNTSNNNNNAQQLSPTKVGFRRPMSGARRRKPGVQSADSIVLPHSCALMFFSSHLRPSRKLYEVMPRPSILDITVGEQKQALPNAPVSSKRRGKKDPFVKVKRRSKAADKENKARLNFEINYRLHMNHTTTTTATTATAATDIDKTFPDKVACCGCGLYNSCCRLVPSIEEHPFEALLAARDAREEKQRVENKKQRVASLSPRLRPGQQQSAQSAASTSPKATGNLSPRSTSPIFSSLTKRKPSAAAVSPLMSSKKRAAPAGANASRKMAPSMFSKRHAASTKVNAADPEPVDPLAPTRALISKLRGIYGGRVIDDAANIAMLRDAFTRRNAAAAVIARAFLAYRSRQLQRKARIEMRVLQYKVCQQHYTEKILGVVLGKVTRAYDLYREQRETKQMQIEENTMRKFVYYNKLQSGLISIDAVSFATKQAFGKMSTLVPRVTDMTVTDAWRPSFAFTWNSIRAQQLRLDPTRRMSSTLLAEITRDIPRFSMGRHREGNFFDRDLAVFTDRYMRDVATEQWRNAVKQKEKKMREQREAAAAMALERLKQKSNAKKALLLAADALTARFKGGAPPPPAGPPPPHIIRANRAKEKLAKRKAERDAIQRELEQEDAEFDVLKHRPRELYRKSRFSISDPSKLSQRISTMRHHLQTCNRFKRRNSLPENITALRVFTRPRVAETIEQITQSLELFETRLSYLKRVKEGIDRSQQDPLYASQKPSKYFERNARMLFEFNFCDPRLPFEMNTLLLDGYRRRTIGEPQRFRMQLEMNMEMREHFSDVVFTCSEAFQMKRRRRSFDHGEYLDITSGVDEVLGFEFEDLPQVVTVSGLRKDSAELEYSMLKAGFIELDEVSVSTRQRMQKVAQETAAGSSSKRASRSKMPKRQQPHSNEGQLAANSGSSRKNGAFSRSAKLGLGGAGGAGGGGFGGGRGDSFKGNTGSSRKAYFSTARMASEKRQDYLAEVGEGSHLGAVQEEDESVDSFNAGVGYYSSSAAAAGSLTGRTSRTGGEEQWGGGIFGTGTSQSLHPYGTNGGSVDWQGDVQIWQEHYTEDGRAYYYNEYSGESIWDYPSGNVQLETQNQDEDGNWYWWNVVTGESKWM